MPMTVICPACGKHNRLQDDDVVGEVILCLACGGQILIEAEETPAPASTAEELQIDAEPAAAQADGPGGDDATEWDVSSDIAAAAAASSIDHRRSRPAAAAAAGRRKRAMHIVLTAGVACLVLATLIGLVVMRVDPGETFSAEESAELLEMKSEAERLVVEGQLEAAHAKYRQIQERLAGRDVQGSPLADVAERVKVDQDRVYALLLNKAGTRSPSAPVSAKRRTVGSPADESPTPADDAPESPASTPPLAEGDGPTASSGASQAQSSGPSGDAPPAPAADATSTATQPDQPNQSMPRAIRISPSGLPAIANAPAPPPWIKPTDVTDAQVGFAITRGVDFLLSQVQGGQVIRQPDMSTTRHAGLNALVVYALLDSFRATKDPRLNPRGEFMAAMLDKMKSHQVGRGPNEPRQPATYARSLRAAALALAGRPEDRDVLKADAQWLIRTAVDGAYTYDESMNSLSPGPRSDATGSPWSSDPWQTGDRAGLGGRRDASDCQPRRLPPPLPPPPTNEPPGTIPSGTAPPLVMGGAMVGIWDNSNSQYGLLGVWAAAEAGIEVPNKYWESVRKHWESCQLRSGEWGYVASDRTGRLAMTCGGVASLWVTHDWLEAPRTRGQVGREVMSAPLKAGMDWLETADNATDTPKSGMTHYFGYDIFSLERVGLASGFKYFGSHDWYRELASRSVLMQSASGAWTLYQDPTDNVIETAYILLFLSHGRHPLFMNKLRFAQSRVGVGAEARPSAGFWSNRPRDIANLTRFAARDLERPFNWQVVDLNREWYDWFDCPVLYIASHVPPTMTDADFEKLRQFTEAGGILFTHADAGSQPFTKWVVEELAPKVCPGRQPNILPQDHWIYTLNWDLRKPRPQLWGVSNGSRLLLVHSTSDLGAAWQQRDDRGRRDLFRLGAHIFLYACGKLDFRNRIDTPYVPPAPEGKQPALPVARIKYAGGDWDPEPGSWRRFASLYQWEMDTSVPLVVTDLASLDPKKTPLAHLTGTLAVNFTDADAKAVNRFVAGGGILLVDPCGGSPAFDKSARALLAKAFPGIRPNVVPTDHPLFATADPKGKPLTLRLRPYDIDKLKMTVPPLERIAVNEGVVIISHVDITTGLLGTNTLTVVGYDAPVAQAVVWNLLAWTQAQRSVRGGN